MKILITDDSPEMKDLYACLFSPTSNMEVDYAGTVSEARKCFYRTTYDLVFMDHDLDRSDITGLDLCAEIKRRSAATRLVMVTSHQEAEIRRGCELTGVNKLVHKTANFVKEIRQILHCLNAKV